MTLKIIGSSHKEEFVNCRNCKKKYVWLNAYQSNDFFYGKEIGVYFAICSKCKKTKQQVKKK